MLKIKEYLRPETIEEAYEMGSLPNSLYVSGGLIAAQLKISRLERLVDLKTLGMDEIEDGSIVKIGANAKLTTFMNNPILSSQNNGFFKEVAKDIGSTQIRNMATIGGSIAFKLGWSDVITIFMVTESQVEFYDGNFHKTTLENFIKDGKRDQIITAVYLPKNTKFMAFEKFAKSTFDIATLNLGIALSLENELIKEITIVVGSRPMISERVREVEDFLKGKDLLNSIDKAANLMESVVKVGTDMRASAEYRKALAGALLKKAMRRICYESGIQG